MRYGREAYARCATGNVDTLQQLSADKYYGNIVTEVQPTTTLTAPEPLDVVWTSQNYHDYPDEFMGKGDPSILNKAAFKLLKPGGTYMVIDHMAKPGRGLADTDTLHRVDPATVRQAGRGRGLPLRRRVQGARKSGRSAGYPGVRQVDPRPHQPVRLQIREAEAGSSSRRSPRDPRQAARQLHGAVEARFGGRPDRDTASLLSGRSFAAPLSRAT